MKPGRKRKLVNEVCYDWTVSIRRAFGLLVLDPKSYRYTSRRRDQAALELRIREICETRVRYGYRRVYVMLRREGWVINMKKVRRIYNELGLQLRNKTPKRWVKAKLRDDRREATGSHDAWAVDFAHDQLASGHKIRILTLIDIYSRYSPVIDPRFSYRGEDVVATLERVCREHGYPQSIRVDQGGVHLPRPRPVGLPEGRRARLLSARQADRQLVHRVLQRQVPRGMSERPLVPDACRCGRKDGGLA